VTNALWGTTEIRLENAYPVHVHLPGITMQSRVINLRNPTHFNASAVQVMLARTARDAIMVIMDDRGKLLDIALHVTVMDTVV
jgi:hypothetical protein